MPQTKDMTPHPIAVVQTMDVEWYTGGNNFHFLCFKLGLTLLRNHFPDFPYTKRTLYYNAIILGYGEKPGRL